MDSASLFTYAITIGVLAIKPGPGVLAVVSKTASRGVAGFSTYMAGALSGEMIFLALVVFGFAIAGDQLVFLSLLLKALAGVYLIYLGYNTLKEPISLNPSLKTASSLKNGWEDYSTGLMLTLSNPFVIVVFGGIVPTVIDPGTVGLTDFAILAAVTAVMQLSGDLAYCLPVMLSRRFFNNQTLNRLRLASGIVMILIGLYLGYSALPAQDLKAVFQ